jgi:hypothetical protein
MWSSCWAATVLRQGAQATVKGAQDAERFRVGETLKESRTRTQTHTHARTQSHSHTHACWEKITRIGFPERPREYLKRSHRFSRIGDCQLATEAPSITILDKASYRAAGGQEALHVGDPVFSTIIPCSLVPPRRGEKCWDELAC